MEPAEIGDGMMLYARAGARVFVVDIDKDAAEDTVAGILVEGGTAEAWRADITNEEDVIAAVRACYRLWGRIDILPYGPFFAGPEGCMMQPMKTGKGNLTSRSGIVPSEVPSYRSARLMPIVMPSGEKRPSTFLFARLDSTLTFAGFDDPVLIAELDRYLDNCRNDVYGSLASQGIARETVAINFRRYGSGSPLSGGRMS